MRPLRHQSFLFLVVATVASTACVSNPPESTEDGGVAVLDAGMDATVPPDAEVDATVDAAPDVEGVDAGDAASDVGPGDAGAADTGPADAGPADTGPIDAGPPPCDINALPLAQCALTNAAGVFVSSTFGSNGADGTKDLPYTTLAAGLAKAATTTKRLYLCAETAPYAESLTVVNGVSIFGGITCVSKNWLVDATKRAVIAPASSPAATASSITVATRLDGLTIKAPNAVAAGGSSIGMIATNTTALTLANSSIEAGAAKDGTDGATPEPLTVQAIAGGPAYPVPGSAAVYQFNPPQTAWNTGKCATPNGVDSGIDFNRGGAGFPRDIHYIWVTDHWYRLWGAGENWAPNHRTAPENDPARNAAGAYALKNPPVLGGNWIYLRAANGTNGAAGGNGANAAPGSFSATGFVTAPATVGQAGKPGIGGGGGGGTTLGPGDDNVVNAYPGGGGDGGFGGCPGRPGGAGTSGGASVALLAYASPVALVATNLVSKAGGRGGAAGGNGAPSAGLPGGNGVDAFSSGGTGGAGGAAGISGHGASGPSYGIAYQGGVPTRTGGGTITVAAPAPGQPDIGLGATPAGGSAETYVIP